MNSSYCRATIARGSGGPDFSCPQEWALFGHFRGVFGSRPGFSPQRPRRALKEDISLVNQQDGQNGRLGHNEFTKNNPPLPAKGDNHDGPASMLFSWDDVERLGDLRRLEWVLRYLPDEPVVQALKARRGRGRDDYPIEAMWRALMAGVVFQHDSIASLVRELRRNPALLEVCGFAALPRQGRTVRTIQRDAQTGQARVVSLSAPVFDNVPAGSNLSRFLSNVVRVEESLARLQSAKSSRKTGRTSDPDADWGKHETQGVLIRSVADSAYEIPVWFDHRSPTASGNLTLRRRRPRSASGCPARWTSCSARRRSWRNAARTSAPTRVWTAGR